MLKIHEFWVELFPIFKDSYEFIYIYLDISTILILIKLFISVPSMIIDRSKRI